MQKAPVDGRGGHKEILAIQQKSPFKFGIGELEFGVQIQVQSECVFQVSRVQCVEGSKSYRRIQLRPRGPSQLPDSPRSRIGTKITLPGTRRRGNGGSRKILLELRSRLHDVIARKRGRELERESEG